MKPKKILSFVLVALLLISMAITANAQALTDLPRNETLYFGGQQWGPLNGTNPISDDNNNAMGFERNGGGGTRTVTFETLYMYNFLDGSQTPLLADGPYVWNDKKTEMTVKIKKAAKWSDGTPVTAHDFAYTYASFLKYGLGVGNAYKPYVASVEAIDDSTVLIKSVLNDAGLSKNPLQLQTFVSEVIVAQKAWIEALEKRNDNDSAKITKDPGLDAVYSGPYGLTYHDEQKVVYTRNDNYWGQDPSMWGKLPAPKYIAHTIFKDNGATQTAFEAGQIDVNQQFLPNIQDLWLKKNLPISTYMQEAPYGICLSMPSAWYNLSSYGLDNPVIRKAIAIAVDYDTIIANAMTNQSPSFKDVPRSCMNPTAGEQALFDHEKVKALQWVGKDIEGANKILDEAGIIDTDKDGFREYNGKKLSYKACCPNGWTDWMAAIEIVAAAGKNIGIEIVSEYPEWSVYQTVVTSAKQSDYDIFMMWTDSASPSMPWGRVRQLMSSEYNGLDNNWSGNWGHYSNARIDEILQLIPQESDAAKLKEYYTEAVEIYLTDIPSFALMYRPLKFHAVNETVWTNYPEAGDGNNIPPGNLTDGYGIAGLYNIELVNP